MSESRYVIRLSELPPPGGWVPIWMVEEITREAWNHRRRFFFAVKEAATACYGSVLAEYMGSPLDDKIINLWLILVEEERAGPLLQPMLPADREGMRDNRVFAEEIVGFCPAVDRGARFINDDDDDDDVSPGEPEEPDLQDYLNEAYSSTLCATSDPEVMRLRLKRVPPQTLLANTPLYPRYRLVCRVAEVGDAAEIDCWFHNHEVTARLYCQYTSRDGVEATYFLWRQVDVTRFMTWAAGQFPSIQITRDNER